MIKDHFRAFERRAVNLPAVLIGDDVGELSARVVDLGLGGAKVAFQRSGLPKTMVRSCLRRGAPWTLRVTAANLWDPLCIEAQVAWSSEGREVLLGLDFQHEGAPTMGALLGVLTADAYT